MKFILIAFILLSVPSLFLIERYYGVFHLFERNEEEISEFYEEYYTGSGDIEEKKKRGIIMGFNKYLTEDDLKKNVPIIYQYLYIKQFTREEYVLIFYEYEEGYPCVSRLNNTRHPAWCKILAVNHSLYLDDLNFEYVLWLDSDAIIATNRTFEEILIRSENRHDYEGKKDYYNCSLYFTSESENVLDHNPCSGVFFVKNNQNSKNFLNYWWESNEYDLKFDMIHIWEQMVLFNFYRKVPEICIFNMSQPYMRKIEPFSGETDILHYTHDYYDKEFNTIISKLKERLNLMNQTLVEVYNEIFKDASKKESKFRHYKLRSNYIFERVLY